VWLSLDRERLVSFTDFSRTLVDRLEQYAASAAAAKE